MIFLKKGLVLISGLLMILTVNSINVQAEGPQLSSVCREKGKLRNEQYSQAVMKDIISTFKLDINENSYYEVTPRDLEAANLIYGGKEKDPYYNTLNEQFHVSSRGGAKLFLKPQEAYLLYKQLDHTNVMLHLKLNGSKWEVVDVDHQKKSGNHIEYNLLACEKEYLKKRNEYQAKIKKNAD